MKNSGNNVTGRFTLTQTARTNSRTTKRSTNLIPSGPATTILALSTVSLAQTATTSQNGNNVTGAFTLSQRSDGTHTQAIT